MGIGFIFINESKSLKSDNDYYQKVLDRHTKFEDFAFSAQEILTIFGKEFFSDGIIRYQDDEKVRILELADDINNLVSKGTIIEAFALKRLLKTNNSMYVETCYVNKNGATIISNILIPNISGGYNLGPRTIEHKTTTFVSNVLWPLLDACKFPY